jgi:hypothetical protein
MFASAAQVAASGTNIVGTCSLVVWCPVSTPNQSSNNVFYGTAALSNNDAWAVGGYNDGFTGGGLLTEHWDGNAWTTAAPASVPGSARFQATSATASNDVWAVGFDSYVGNVQLTLAQHWNGSSWSTVSTPNVDPSAGQNLSAVAAVSTTNIWAVGAYDRGGNHTGDGIDFTLIEHWNSTAWSQVTSPNINPGSNFNALFGVAAVSSNDVWAAGYHTNSIYNDTPRPLLEHWDGTSWSIPASLPNPGADSILYGVAAYSANDVWAVGAINPFGTPQPLIIHWDGTSWTVATSLPPVSGGQLRGIAITPQHDIWAVGGVGSAPLVMHWVGNNNGNINAWVVFPAAYPNAGGELRAVSSPPVQSAPTRLWGVGSSSDGSTNYSLADTFLAGPIPQVRTHPGRAMRP